jgi:hypothetical protein
MHLSLISPLMTSYLMSSRHVGRHRVHRSWYVPLALLILKGLGRGPPKYVSFYSEVNKVRWSKNSLLFELREVNKLTNQFQYINGLMCRVYFLRKSHSLHTRKPLVC